MWEFWAREQKNLTSSERSILTEIAFFSDPKGTTITNCSWLSTQVGVARGTVQKSLASLSEKGLLRYEHTYIKGVKGQRRTLIQLIRSQVTRPTSGLTTHVATPKNSGKTNSIVNPELHGIKESIRSNEGFRAALSQVILEGWDSEIGHLVTIALQEVASKKFVKIWKRRSPLFDSNTECITDTLNLSWVALHEQIKAVQAATNPWGYLTSITQTACARHDKVFSPLVEDPLSKTLKPIEAPLGDIPFLRADEQGSYQIAHSHHDLGEYAYVIGIDDLLPNEKRIGVSLIDAGIDEPLVWASITRVLNVAAVEKTRRHTVIRRDHKMLSLGFNEDASAELMNLLTGHRNEFSRSNLEKTSNFNDFDFARISNHRKIESQSDEQLLVACLVVVRKLVSTSSHASQLG